MWTHSFTREEVFERAFGLERLYSLMSCDEQHELRALFALSTEAKADLAHYRRAIWSRDQRDWVRAQETKVDMLGSKLRSKFAGLLVMVYTLEGLTSTRRFFERGLKHDYALKRRTGQRLSAMEMETEEKFGTAATYVVNMRGGAAGFFELERAFDTRALIQDRLEGSCLFMYE